MKSCLIVCASIAIAGAAVITSQLGARNDFAADAPAPVEQSERGVTPLTTTLFANGLERPIYVTHAPGDFTRLFVIEKRGRIRVIEDGVLLPASFLNIDALVGGGTSDFDERGLLGLAFHPDYQNNDEFYVSYTNNSNPNDTVIARYTVSADPNVANGAGDIIMFVDQPFTNHNGGWMGFGPSDGLLYISLGDGGSFCDPQERSQNINLLLGKMLRIDVNSDDFPADTQRDYAIPPSNPFAAAAGADEIWAYGLRNAWRPSFDRATNDLYIADVGQDIREEINFQAAASVGGENYGWDCMEGLQCASLSGCGAGACVCNAATLADPFHEYNHFGGRCSITGGYVYRGCEIPTLQGTYFFADFCSNQIWSFDGGAAMNNFQERTAELAPGGGLSITSITSFGEDAFGEMYICDQSGGEIFKIVIDGPPAGPDCNNNGVCDPCEVLSGDAPDVNMNGIPDECDTPPCPWDLNGDGNVGSADFAQVLGSWGPNPGAAADFDGDGNVGSGDLAALLGAWGACPQ